MQGNRGFPLPVTITISIPDSIVNTNRKYFSEDHDRYNQKLQDSDKDRTEVRIVPFSGKKEYLHYTGSTITSTGRIHARFSNTILRWLYNLLSILKLLFGF